MLQPQNISLTLDASIDTKRDEFLTDGTAFLVQENARFQKAGAITKRQGFDGANSGLATLVSGGFSPKKIVSDSKQIFIDGQASEKGAAIYYNNTWQQVGSETIANNTSQGQIELVDKFGGDALADTAYSDYYGGIHAIAVNRIRNGNSAVAYFPILYIFDGQKYITSENFTTSAVSDTIVSLKCAIIQVSSVNYVITACIYTSGGSNYLRVSCFNMSGVRQYETDTLLSASSSFVAIRAASARNKAYIATYNGATSIRAQVATQSSVTTSTTITTTATLASVHDIVEGSTVAILCRQTSNYPVVVGVTSSLVASWEQAESNATLSLGTLSNNSDSFGININTSTFVYSFFSLDSSGNRRANVLTGTSAGFSMYSYDYGVQPVSRPLVYNSEYYLAVKSQSGSTYSSFGFAKIKNTSPVGFYYVCSAAYSAMSSSTRNMGGGVEAGLGVFYIPALIATRTDFTQTVFSSDVVSAANLFKVNVSNSDNQYGSVCNLNDSLIYYAGNPTFFDGSSQRSAGFYFPPSLVAINSGAGGTILAGTYLYKVLWELQDDQGNVLRSEESDQYSVTTTGSTSSVAITIRLSSWIPTRAMLTILRTKANSSVFYVLYKGFIPLATSAFTYTDTTPDSSVTSSTIQSYTTGGILENTPPPPTKHATIHQNRVWVVPADEKDKVYYSKKFIPGEMPSFSVFQYVQQVSTIPSLKDDIRGIGALTDKLIILRDRSCYFIAGDGVNEAGTGDSITEPELISQDIGCTEPRSIISTPIGLMFKSNKGIYSIDAGLGVKYIGDRVELYNSEEIIDSAIVPNKNIVVFATNSRLLVYDYVYDKWSTDPISGIKSIGVWNDSLCILKTDGTFGVQGTLFQDSFSTTDNISMKVGTGWMKLSGIQDFGRVWRVLILGRYWTDHTLTAKVYYDYDTSYVETYTITPNPLNGIYQFNIHLARQKCEAMKIEIYDTGTGQSMDLTGITLQVGVKKGVAKIPATRKV